MAYNTHPSKSLTNESVTLHQHLVFLLTEPICIYLLTEPICIYLLTALTTHIHLHSLALVLTQIRFFRVTGTHSSIHYTSKPIPTHPPLHFTQPPRFPLLPFSSNHNYSFIVFLTIIHLMVSIRIMYSARLVF